MSLLKVLSFLVMASIALNILSWLIFHNSSFEIPNISLDFPPLNITTIAPKIINDVAITKFKQDYETIQSKSKTKTIIDKSSTTTGTEIIINTAVKENISWKKFISYPSHESTPITPDSNLFLYKPEAVCSSAIVEALRQPRLSKKDFAWCRWALSSEGGGGGVRVGKSWGKLDDLEKRSFDALSCNIVFAQGRNPSCDDSWGDAAIQRWAPSPPSPPPKGFHQCGSRDRSSDTRCQANDNGDLSCQIKNAMIHFGRYRHIQRAGLNLIN
jgi:hypothetical protein